MIVIIIKYFIFSALTETRVIIERNFGVLKNRFKILSNKIKVKSTTYASEIIKACFILNNIIHDTVFLPSDAQNFAIHPRTFLPLPPKVKNAKADDQRRTVRAVEDYKGTLHLFKQFKRSEQEQLLF